MTRSTSPLEKFRRTAAAIGCLIVGAASFALSYVALRDVAVEVEAVPAYLGFLVPVVIDGGVICGSAVIWSLSKSSTRRPAFPFLFVASLVLISVVVNANHAGPGVLAKGIASLPPLILLGTLELVASQGRRLERERAAADLEVKLEARPAVPVGGPVSPVQGSVRPAHDNATAPRPGTVSAEKLHQGGLVGAFIVDERFKDSPGLEESLLGESMEFDQIDAELQEITQPSRSRGPVSRKPLRLRAEEPLH